MSNTKLLKRKAVINAMCGIAVWYSIVTAVCCVVENTNFSMIDFGAALIFTLPGIVLFGILGVLQIRRINREVQDSSVFDEEIFEGLTLDLAVSEHYLVYDGTGGLQILKKESIESVSFTEEDINRRTLIVRRRDGEPFVYAYEYTENELDLTAYVILWSKGYDPDKYRLCPDCGTIIPEQYSYCPECGKDMRSFEHGEYKPSDTARLATVITALIILVIIFAYLIVVIFGNLRGERNDTVPSGGSYLSIQNDDFAESGTIDITQGTIKL